MKKSTMDEVCAYLFREGSLSFVVLGQDSCKTLKCKDRFGRMATYKEPGTNKELFLKYLNVLTAHFQGCFSSNNTIIVDDSPRKHMMNNPENVILTDSWSNRGNGDKDTFLLAIPLPWFQKLHANQTAGLKSFWKNLKKGMRIGRQMLC